MTCAPGAWVATGASMTIPTVGARACCCDRSRSLRRWTPSRRAGTQALRILLDPGGQRFDQARAQQLATQQHLVLLCPRYEGIDDRVRSMVDLELSIGDYVLSGGEIPALVIIDSILRLLPGVIDAASPADESFAAGLLEYPQYTRPAEYRGMTVPDVLLSGHHGEVERWRREQALERTRRVRPDLLPPGS